MTVMITERISNHAETKWRTLNETRFRQYNGILIESLKRKFKTQKQA